MHKLQWIVLRRPQICDASDISNFWGQHLQLELCSSNSSLTEFDWKKTSKKANTHKHARTHTACCTELGITEQSADLCRVGAEMVGRQCCSESCERNPQKPSCIVHQQKGWGENRVSLCVDPAGRDTEIFSNQEKLNLLTGSLCRAC